MIIVEVAIVSIARCSVTMLHTGGGTFKRLLQLGMAITAQQGSHGLAHTEAQRIQHSTSSDDLVSLEFEGA